MINLGSTRDLSCLFFGGTFTEVVREPQFDIHGNPLLTKTGPNKGTIKLKNVNKEIKITGFGLKPLKQWANKKADGYSTNEEVLKFLSQKKNHPAAKIATKLLELRGLSKELGTYYEGVGSLIYPDDKIHPAFVHVATDTSRLASKNPNVQNVPGSAVKAHFVSRYTNGHIIAFDYSQIEVVTQAQISGDEQYISDVIEGKDMHCVYLAFKENMCYNDVYRLCQEEKVPEWVEKRSNIKAFTFSRAFGAGAKSISYKTGIPLDEVKQLIQTEEEVYSGLSRYNANLSDYVTSVCDSNGFGVYASPITGCRWTFQKKEAPDWIKEKGINKTFKPTELKNYPVQGTAANIVLCMVGRLWRKSLQYRDRFVLINTVHDSVMVDCKPEWIEWTKDFIQKELQDVHAMVKERFNYEWKTPFKIDVKSGRSWSECE
jgi:DNA polymerase-1